MKKRILRWIIPSFVIICGIAALVRAGAGSGASGFSVQKQAPAEAADGNGKLPLPDEVRTGAEDNKVTERGSESGAVGEKMIYVHVCGAVLSEGVYALDPGSRVVDAIDAAGGFAPEADRSYHNLAGLLTDGQKIYIPTEAETEEMRFLERERAEQTEYGSGDGMEKQGKRLNLNTAGKEELMLLPGIGEAKAESILRYRNKVGRFKSIEEIMNVSGIGEAMFERIRELIFAE